MQYVYRPGWASVDMLTTPGVAPPTFTQTRRSARPIVALARHPEPKTPAPQLMSSAVRIGPPTITSGDGAFVVADTPWRSNASSHTASTAAITTGRYSGRQPAITALTATFSTVAPPMFGGTTATTSCAPRRVPPSMRTTRSGVGGTTGSPSVRPRPNRNSNGPSAAG